MCQLPFQMAALPKVGGADISQDLHSRIIFAMRSLDSFVDVSEEDLVYLANTVINNMPGQNQKIGKALK